MKKRFFNLQLFDTDAQIIDRSGHIPRWMCE